MVLKEVGEQIAKTNIINFAAALALFLYVFLTWQHVVIAIQAEDPMMAFKDVLLWTLPVLLNIMATYGILKAKE